MFVARKGSIVNVVIGEKEICVQQHIIWYQTPQLVSIAELVVIKFYPLENIWLAEIATIFSHPKICPKVF